jgi:hypothetical protein
VIQKKNGTHGGSNTCRKRKNSRKNPALLKNLERPNKKKRHHCFGAFFVHIHIDLVDDRWDKKASFAIHTRKIAQRRPIALFSAKL